MVVAKGGLSAARLARGLAVLAVASWLAACAQIDRHGHVFMDFDFNQIQPGMSKDQVKLALGSPDTTSTIGGDAFYYISSTTKTVSFMKPTEVDRKVVAVYFDRSDVVTNVAHYGLKDGLVVDFLKDETPARGKDLTLLQQFFSNLGQRRLFQDGTTPTLPGRGGRGGPGGIPGGI